MLQEESGLTSANVEHALGNPFMVNMADGVTTRDLSATAMLEGFQT